jgi:threonine synthase
MYATGLRCVRCQARFPLGARATCAACLPDPGDASIEDTSLSQTLAVDYDEDRLRSVLDRDRLAARPPGLWRYAELLPVGAPACRVDLGAGGTRLAALTRLQAGTGVELLAKVEGGNPTGSFKDRPIGVAASVALERGATTLAAMTSGNIGSALAAAAARAGVAARILLLAAGGLTGGEAEVSLEKSAQIQAYGARVFTPAASMRELTRLAREAAGALGWTWMHDLAAFQAEGDKTTAFEICEQLGWRVPDWVVVPVGTGTHLFGLWAGFAQLQRLGFTAGLPRMAGVQPAGADAMVRALDRGDPEMAPLAAVTLNLALPITHRVAGHHAYHAVRASGGTAVAVTDAEMRQAVLDLATREGIYTEPAAAAALAGARTLIASGAAWPGSRIVCVLTSHGLKASVAMRAWFPPPPRIEPRLDALADAAAPGEPRGH